MSNGSRWRNDREWQQRVARDRALLVERLDEVQLEFARGMVAAGDGGGQLDFLVVYGSAARGDAGEDSDVDVYFEARDLGEPFNRQDPNGFFHAFGMPAGTMLANLRRGDPLAFRIADEAIVVTDTGRYRELLIAIDEQGLEPREGQDP